MPFSHPGLALQAEHRLGSDERLEEVLPRGAGLTDVAVGAEDSVRERRRRDVRDVRHPDEPRSEDRTEPVSVASEERDRIMHGGGCLHRRGKA